MYKLLKHGAPYFRYMKGPWEKTFDTACAVAADVNNDQLDDLLVCEKHGGECYMYVQNSMGRFDEVPLPKEHSATQWRNLRVGSVTNQELPDLVVVKGWHIHKPYLLIYSGIPEPPYFDFEQPYLKMELPYAAADLEILDVNEDGYKDIYVLQSNEAESDEYCGYKGGNIGKVWWGQAKPLM